MEKCEVTLKIYRAGVHGEQCKGDKIEVDLLEAGRLLAQDNIEPLNARTMKAMAKAEAAALVETATAPAEAAETATAPADPVDAPAADPADTTAPDPADTTAAAPADTTGAE